MDAAAHVRAVFEKQGPDVAAELCEALLKVTHRRIARSSLEAVGVALGLLESRQAEEARRARLASCPLHIFDMEGIERVAGKIPPRLTCVMCDEWMPTLEAAAYARGYEAHGGDPNDVIPGFRA